jgi:hypothetical protein
MSATKRSKPQMHQSGLETLFRCGEQYKRIYILGQRVPPDVPRIRGISVHHAAARNLTYKVEHKGRLLSLSHVKDIARDAFVKSWKSEPVKLTLIEQQLGVKKVRGLGIDTSVKLAALHHKELAPIIFPIKGGIERKWVIQCPGRPFDLAGQLDVQEEPESYGIRIVRLRDLKTKSKSPTQSEVNSSIQFTLYNMAIEVNDKKKVDEVWMDALVTTKTPKCVSLKSARSANDFKAFMNLFDRACEVITKDAFTPTSPRNWWCSKTWCGFYAGDPERGIEPCPFVSGRTSVPVIKVSKKEREASHGRTKEGGRSVAKIRGGKRKADQRRPVKKLSRKP